LSYSHLSPLIELVIYTKIKLNIENLFRRERTTIGKKKDKDLTILKTLETTKERKGNIDIRRQT